MSAPAREAVVVVDDHFSVAAMRDALAAAPGITEEQARRLAERLAERLRRRLRRG